MVPQKENGLVKRSENHMKDIIGISIVYWRVNLRMINVSVKVDF